MAIRWTLWTDGDGYTWRRGIPEDAPEEHAARGIPGGPPDIRPIAEELGWPEAFTRAVHQGLVDRRLFTDGDLRAAGGARALTPVVNRAARAGANVIADLYARTARRPST